MSFDEDVKILAGPECEEKDIPIVDKVSDTSPEDTVGDKITDDPANETELVASPCSMCRLLLLKTLFVTHLLLHKKHMWPLKGQAPGSKGGKTSWRRLKLIRGGRFWRPLLLLKVSPSLMILVILWVLMLLQ